MGGGAMTIERRSVLVWTVLLESVTLTVNLAVPLAVAVPEITPDPDARDKPAGSVPVKDQV
jgi:hypothetical protein